MIYFSYFPSIMTYGLVIWGSSYHSNTVFKLQKRIIRIMVAVRDRESCREYFRFRMELRMHMAEDKTGSRHEGIENFLADVLTQALRLGAVKQAAGLPARLGMVRVRVPF
jgi:hypothetical protein